LVLVGRIQIADYLLGENWQGRKAVSSIFLMSDQVLNLLGIKNDAWNEKYGVGRILLPALAYSSPFGLCFIDELDCACFIDGGEWDPMPGTSSEVPFYAWTHLLDVANDTFSLDRSGMHF
tara:strand:- start:186 stop:545 length:360 start_codon:yes stop_codon:yes gene_type:complete